MATACPIPFYDQTLVPTHTSSHENSAEIGKITRSAGQFWLEHTVAISQRGGWMNSSRYVQ